MLETDHPSRRITRLDELSVRDELWSKIRLNQIRLLARLQDVLTDG